MSAERGNLFVGKDPLKRKINTINALADNLNRLSVLHRMIRWLSPARIEGQSDGRGGFHDAHFPFRSIRSTRRLGKNARQAGRSTIKTNPFACSLH